MLRFHRFLSAALFSSLSALALLATPVHAAATKTYQVTGPVVDVSDSAITVEKGKEKWQIARDKETKSTGEIKPGTKVTIEYRMTATSIEVKGDKGDKAKGDADKSAAAKEKPAKDKK